MSITSGSKRGAGIVSILAMLGLVGFAVWFNLGCSDKSQQPATTTSSTSQQSDADVTVKIDLPDTVTITP